MNKKLKLISCALAVTLSIVVVENTVKYGPIGVDVISAATGEAATTPTKTTTTTVSTPTATSITRLLALNSVGGDVKLLQTWLNSNGSSLKVDGIFGKLTLAAVKSYQSKNGLVVDGIVGPKTIAKLTPVVVTPPVVAPPVVAPPVVTPPVVAPPVVTPPVVTPPVVTPPVVTPPVDTVSSASIVDNAAAFQKAISPVDKGGKWIIAITKDVTSDKALVLDGEFTNGKQDATTKLNVIQRKIALYAQDDKHVVTARFNLVAPKLTILSPNASVEHGNFKGDLYVSAPNFKLINAKIDGNVYFTNKAAKDTFTIADKDGDQKTVITGKQEVKLTEDVDVVATASVVNNKDAFEKAISKDGKWIIAVLDNLTFDKSLTLEGEFKNGKKDAVTGADLYQRKIALYAHAADKTTDARFTLTAPKLTINSPMASIEHGIFKGDVYVTVPNFKLVDAIVDGNVYFTTQAAKDTFKIDAASIITGQTAVKIQ